MSSENYFQQKYRQERKQKEENPFEEYIKKSPSPNPVMGLIEAASNFVPSAVNVAGNIQTALSRPVETAKGMGDVAQATGNYLGRRAAEMRTGQTIEPMPERSEAAFENVVQGVESRYGSPENIYRTFREDPAGMMLDVSGVGAATRNPLLMSAEPLGLIGRGGQAALRGTQVPERIMRRSLNIPASKGSEMASRTARTALDEKIPVSRGGSDKITDVRGDIGSKIESIVNAATEIADPDVPFLIPKQVVIKGLDDLRESRRGMHGEAADVATIDKARREFLQQYENVEQLTPQQLQRYKVDIYDQAYKKDAMPSVDREGSPGMDVQTMRTMGRGAREGLETKMPDEYAVQNKRFERLSELKPFLDRRIDSISQADPSFGKLIQQTITSPNVWSRVAHGVDRIMQGDLGGAEKILNSRELRIALALSGRNEEMYEDNY